MLSRPSRARGLKQKGEIIKGGQVIASITGAWIETLSAQVQYILNHRVHHGRVD